MNRPRGHPSTCAPSMAEATTTRARYHHDIATGCTTFQISLVSSAQQPLGSVSARPRMAAYPRQVHRITHASSVHYESAEMYMTAVTQSAG